MSAALADLTGASSPSRRQRAAKTVDAALRGGVIAGGVAGVAWLLALGFGTTAVFLAVIATVLGLVYTVVRGEKARMGVWGLIAVVWALVVAQRWLVNDNGAVLIALVTWIGVVLGVRRAGIAKKSLVLLAYPLISVAIIVAAGQSVLDPWGMD
jgi:hypothetical protein